MSEKIKNKRHGKVDHLFIFIYPHLEFKPIKLEANSFPRASHFGTGNVLGWLSEHIFAPNERYFFYVSIIYNFKCWC